MRTDKELYRVFGACPDWVFLLTGLAAPGKSTLRSITLKALESRLDGLIVPDDHGQPLTVVEFQLRNDETIYLRTVAEMSGSQKQFPGRGVQGIIFFKSRSMDPRTQPWTKVVHSFVLRELLEELEAAQPGHPLVAVFKPLLTPHEEDLAQNAARYYRTIRRAAIERRAKRALLEVFVSWMEQRFKTSGKKEIEAMLLGELPNLEETQSGKELIRIGEKRGFERAIEEFLQAKHGQIPKGLRGKVQKLDIEQARRLLRQLPRCDSLRDVESWLERGGHGNARKAKP